MKQILAYKSGKEIISYGILVPVMYEYEEKPAWRLVFKGTKEECENEFYNFPNELKATYKENQNNKRMKVKEYLSLLSLGKTNMAESLKMKYNL